MRKVHSISGLPSVPAVYAMYGGRGASAYVAYVGLADVLKRRVGQHLIRRDSSIVTGVAAVSLNPDLVTEVSAGARELLRQLCESAKGNHLFAGEQGRRLKRATVDHFFREACRRAGVEGFRFHDLRHEYDSRLGDADVNLKKIARFMGHSNTERTERHIHPTADGLLAATGIATQVRRTGIVPEKLRRVG